MDESVCLFCFALFACLVLVYDFLRQMSEWQSMEVCRDDVFAVDEFSLSGETVERQSCGVALDAEAWHHAQSTPVRIGDNWWY